MVKVQERYAASEPPEREMLFPPALALTEPLQVLVVVRGSDEFTTPDGYVSVNSISESGETPFGLLIVKMIVLFSPRTIEAGRKILVISGAWMGEGVVSPPPWATAFPTATWLIKVRALRE